MKTIHVNDTIHKIFKEFCKKNGFQVNRLTEILIEDFLKKKSEENDVK